MEESWKRPVYCLFDVVAWIDVVLLADVSLSGCSFSS
jgi:hypothetical protein